MDYERIETKNLIIRKARFDDLNSIYNNVWSREVLTKYMLWQVVTNLDEAREKMNRTINFQNTHYSYFVSLKETDEPIGFGGFIDINKDCYEDTGVCISNDYQGKGYGKELMLALLDLVFNKLNGKEFIWTCFKDNEVSKKLCKSLGFKYFKEENRIRNRDKLNYVCEFYYLTKDMYLDKKADYKYL